LKKYFLLSLAGVVVLLCLGKIVAAEPPGEEGFIVRWLVCGPFPNLGLTGTKVDHKTTEIYPGWEKDWLLKDGGEKTIEPREGMSYDVTFPESTFWKPGKITVKWKEFTAEENKVDLLKAFSNEELGIDDSKEHRVRFVAGYAYCVITSPREQRVILAFGSDDGYKIWINHDLFEYNPLRRGVKIDQDMFSLTLKKGRNPVLVKVDQSIGGYGFALRFLTPDGCNFIEDIDISY